ncbi:MAG TPA: NTP transferase domain-containing protein [Rhizomicrobium sp.]
MPDIAGVILAGGAGSRIGGDKALIPFGPGVLLDAVMARAAPQVVSLAISVAPRSAPAYRGRFGADKPLLFDAAPAVRDRLQGSWRGWNG